MIPYGRQTIDEEDIESVIQTLKSDYFQKLKSLKKNSLKD